MPRESRFRPTASFLALTLVLACVALIGFGLDPVRSQEEKAPTWVMPKSGPFSPEQVEIPNARAIAAWARSGHSHATAPAFSHWDAEGEIPPVCAVCHSGQGFRSFHGLDGSAPGLPEKPVPTGGVVDCDTCHNRNLSQVTAITLPSGVEHPVTTGDATCVTCHQGRAAGAMIDKATGTGASDTPNPELGFVNPHYKIAAATQLGGYGKTGYEYRDKTYSGRFLHAKPVETCVSCHNPHSLEVAQETCLTCHQSGDPGAIRISRQSYDGSGDTSKGIQSDIKANSDRLMALLSDYAAEVAGVGMVYDGASYPYFFADANGDGLADKAEGKDVAFKAWTPRLLRAAYNWKYVNADPGIHVHNPHYALELLYDSTEDLARALGRDFGALGLAR